MSNSALSNFGGEEVRVVSTKATPIVKLQAAEGNYLHAVLLSHKERTEKEVDFQGKPKVSHIFGFTLIATNAEVIKKSATGYVPTQVAAGEEVSIYGAPARLTRLLLAIPEGSEVFIQYDGKKKDTINGRTVNAHNFTVKQKKVVAPSVPD